VSAHAVQSGEARPGAESGIVAAPDRAGHGAKARSMPPQAMSPPQPTCGRSRGLDRAQLHQLEVVLYQEARAADVLGAKSALVTARPSSSATPKVSHRSRRRRAIVRGKARDYVQSCQQSLSMWCQDV